MYIYIYVYTHTYVCMYVCVYIYIYTHSILHSEAAESSLSRPSRCPLQNYSKAGVGVPSWVHRGRTYYLSRCEEHGAPHTWRSPPSWVYRGEVVLGTGRVSCGCILRVVSGAVCVNLYFVMVRSAS